MDHLDYARVCVEVKQDAVLPYKIFLSKSSISEVELVVEVEVEFPSKQARRGHISAQCHSQPASSLLGRNLGSRETPIPPAMDKGIGVQQNGPAFAHDLGQPDADMCYEVPDDLVPGLDQPELGLGPIKALCPIDTDRVEKSSVLSTNLQMVDRPLADVELIGFLDMVSSPSPLEALADHHGKAHGVLSRGMGAVLREFSEAVKQSGSWHFYGVDITAICPIPPAGLCSDACSFRSIFSRGGGAIVYAVPLVCGHADSMGLLSVVAAEWLFR
ncbi:hypothetical protein Nepgr_016461 [Nepenthes gracilis]|uniref:Uncharacterized protein n=1 Tax=Nepenthes gracilis TaxID=150966 RepID=A0AAD3SPU6_NEPGR|nr:hypothetical protein Nepgr_016461 [Nepenthes gracilis]